MKKLFILFFIPVFFLSCKDGYKEGVSETDAKKHSYFGMPTLDLENLKKTGVEGVFLSDEASLSEAEVKNWKEEWDKRIHFLEQSFPAAAGVFRNEKGESINPKSLKLILASKKEIYTKFPALADLRHKRDYVLVNTESYDEIFTNILDNYNLGYAWKGFEDREFSEHKLNSLAYHKDLAWYSSKMGDFLTIAYHDKGEKTEEINIKECLKKDIEFDKFDSPLVNKELLRFIFSRRKTHGRVICDNLYEFTNLFKYTYESIVSSKIKYFQLKEITTENNPFDFVENHINELINTPNLSEFIKAKNLDNNPHYFKVYQKSTNEAAFFPLEILDEQNKICYLPTEKILSSERKNEFVAILKNLKTELKDELDFNNLIFIFDEPDSQNPKVLKLQKKVFGLKAIEKRLLFISEDLIKESDRKLVKNKLISGLISQELHLGDFNDLNRVLVKCYSSFDSLDKSYMQSLIRRMNFQNLEKTYVELCNINYGFIEGIDKGKIRNIEDLISNIDASDFNSCMNLPTSEELCFFLKNNKSNFRINDFKTKELLKPFLHFYHLLVSIKFVNFYGENQGLLNDLKKDLSGLIENPFEEVSDELFKKGLRHFFLPYRDFYDKMNVFWGVEILNSREVLDYYKMQEDSFGEHYKIVTGLHLKNSSYPYLTNENISVDRHYFAFMRSYEFAHKLQFISNLDYKVKRNKTLDENLIRKLERFTYAGFYLTHAQGMAYSLQSLNKLYEKVKFISMKGCDSGNLQQAFLLGCNLARLKKCSDLSGHVKAFIHRYFMKVMKGTASFEKESSDDRVLTLMTKDYLEGKEHGVLSEFQWKKTSLAKRVFPCLK